MVSKRPILLGDAVCTSKVGRLMMTKYIGIDIGKTQVDICWLRDPETGKKNKDIQKQTRSIS